MGRLGRSAPDPLPWNAVQVVPPSVVTNRWPVASGTADPSRRRTAWLPTRKVLPSVVPPSDVAWRGNATELIPLSGSCVGAADHVGIEAPAARSPTAAWPPPSAAPM